MLSVLCEYLIMSNVSTLTSQESMLSTLKLVVTDKLFLVIFFILSAILVVLAPNLAFANTQATFQLDVSSILTGIGVIVAAVTSIGLAALSVVLVVKAFKYVKTAF